MTRPPSSTSTLDSSERLLVVGPFGSVWLPGSTVEISWKIVIFTVPFSLMVGRTRSVRPTSLRSRGVTGLRPPVVGFG